MLCAAVLSGFASFATASLPASAQDEVIHVGSAGKEADAQVYYAIDMGFFKQAGLNVEVETLPNGSAVAAAVASGALQIGDSNTLSLAVARERGLPFALIAPGAEYRSDSPATLLVVAADGPIKSLRDMQGKTIAGASIGGLDQVSIEAWADVNHLDYKSMKYIELPPGSMIPALQRGTIAAASVADPSLTAALDLKQVRVLSPNYDAIGKTFMWTVWFSTSTWAADNPVLVKKFAAVMVQTALWANANHAKAASILFKYTKFDAHESHVKFATKLDPAEIQTVLDAAYRYKAIKTEMKAAELMK